MWEPAPSVAAALKEATARWPERSRVSDGVIGDAAHSARESDHNPDDRGIVHAFDLTHDPAHGVDCNQLSAGLVTRRDRRVRYIIWNRRIILGPWSSGVLAGSRQAWDGWQPYTGTNPHDHHMHVSVGYSVAAENDVSPWWAGGEEEGDMTDEQARQLKFVFEAIAGAVGAGQKSFPSTIEATLAAVQAARNDAAVAKAGVAELQKRLDALVLGTGTTGQFQVTGTLQVDQP